MDYGSLALITLLNLQQPASLLFLLNSNGNEFFVLIILVALLSGAVVFAGLLTTERRKNKRNTASINQTSPRIRKHSQTIARTQALPHLLYKKRNLEDSSSLPQLPPPTHGGHTTRPEMTAQDPETQENIVKNKRWLELAEECIDLFDELEKLMPILDPPRQEMIQHVEARLQEILTRSGVEAITNDTLFDKSRHRLVPPGQIVEADTPIAEIVSPGFAIGRLVLRPARVRITDISAASDE